MAGGFSALLAVACSSFTAHCWKGGEQRKHGINEHTHTHKKVINVVAFLKKRRKKTTWGQCRGKDADEGFYVSSDAWYIILKKSCMLALCTAIMQRSYSGEVVVKSEHLNVPFSVWDCIQC